MRDKPIEEDPRDRNDSIWAIISGFAKNYNYTIDYVLHEISYANIVMYGAVLPVYRSDSKKKEKEKEKAIDMDNPENANFLDKLINTQL